ncbi:MAG TPA: SET domain-containing protein [Chitinophagales bacterium]|nr:SET domain-containing protein [Chitinophagales bacterium]
MLLPFLYIKDSPGKGRGVFTTEAIEARTLIEIAPVIVLPEKDSALIDQSFLYNYYYLWGEQAKNYAICLGYGSIYNHSYEPNCLYETYYQDEVIHFITLKDIAAGEELTVNYNHDPDNKTTLWFM